MAMTTLTRLDFLLEMDGVRWINCQYDGLRPDEVEYLNQRHPGRLLTLDIDQRNDIEQTAALYALLDFVVSGPTYTADLATCLGRPVIIMANSAATTFCNRPGTDYDAFMPKASILPCRTWEERKLLGGRVRALIESVVQQRPAA
jgi:hypothetical protein